MWILANCPSPRAAPAHTGTATSRAFLSEVLLIPRHLRDRQSRRHRLALGAWVRGQAQVSGTVKRGSYRVDVKCDGTNHVGRATLRVTRADPLPSDVPTRGAQGAAAAAPSARRSTRAPPSARQRRPGARPGDGRRDRGGGQAPQPV